jgi:GNAT superfamily N-acetyltransferase
MFKGVRDATSLIRAARADDVASMQALEKNAAQAFVFVPNHAFCVHLPVRTASEHAQVQRTGIALIMEIWGRPAGFLLVLPSDGRAHILEVAVALAHQRHGCGRRLLAIAETWALQCGFAEMTLTTFRDVAWNAPFYSRLGYSMFEPDEGRPELRAIIEDEAAGGVAQAPRVAMHKILDTPHPRDGR